MLWPWGTTAAPAPNGSALQTLGRRFAWFNGDTPTQSIGLYPTDGTSDGPSHGELGVAACTFELGTSFFQRCAVCEGTIRPDDLRALIRAAKVVRTPYLTPGGPDTLEVAIGPRPVPSGRSATLTAQVTDTCFDRGLLARASHHDGPRQGDRGRARGRPGRVQAACGAASTACQPPPGR